MEQERDKLGSKWRGVLEELAFLEGSKEPLKKLICSEGLLTEALEQTYEGELTLELLGSMHKSLNDVKNFLFVKGFSGFEKNLPNNSNNEVLIREVFLLVGGKRRVFARTVIFIKDTDADFLNALEDSGEPLGRLLQTLGKKKIRESLEFGHVEDPLVAKGLGLSSGEKLFSRRYKISDTQEDSDGANLRLQAFVLEVFCEK
ncbi:MAG: hypothetical protein KAT46_06400 [Deltaproteobacteria bacterium]|nr:hypothetical protein [Deltaproteobacteria bacterium]